jgi:hypothetical protein
MFSVVVVLIERGGSRIINSRDQNERVTSILVTVRGYHTRIYTYDTYSHSYIVTALLKLHPGVSIATIYQQQHLSPVLDKHQSLFQVAVIVR